MNTSALNLGEPVNYSYADYNVNSISDDSSDNLFETSSDTSNYDCDTDNLSDDDIKLLEEELERKVDELKQELENSQNTRGWATSLLNGALSLFGEGDKSKEDTISEYEELLKGLEENPENILQVYESIMGEELTGETLAALQTSENIVSNLDEEEQEAVTVQLENQLEELESEFETAQNSNGWISGSWSKFKNWTGIGASSNKTSAQIDELKEQIESLKNGEADLAVVYKNITGEDLTAEDLESLLNGETTLSDISKAGESLNNYEEGQQMAVDTVADITSGITSVGVVAACSAVGICAAPFTAGASLGMVAAGVGIAAGTGAAVKVAIKGSDCIGNEKTYSLTDAGYDTLTGAANGAMGVFSNGVGSTVGKGIMKAAGMEALETTAKKTFTQGAIKVAASAADMAIDGALSGMTDSATRDIGENIFYGEEHTAQEIVSDSATGFLGGLIASPIIGGGMKGAGKLGSELGSEIADSSLGKMSNEISETLSDTVLGQAAKEAKETLNEKFYSFADDISDTKATNLLNLWGKVEIGDELVDSDYAAKLIDGVDTKNQKELIENFIKLKAQGEEFADADEANKILRIIGDYNSRETSAAKLSDEEIISRYRTLKEGGIEDEGLLAIISTKENVDTDTALKLYENGNNLAQVFSDNQSKATEEIEAVFSGLEDAKTTGRSKSSGSTVKKLANKQNKGTNLVDYDEALNAIGDGYGTRVQISGIKSSETQEIIEKYIQDNNMDISYDEFINKYILNQSDSLDDSVTRSEVLDSLRENQTSEVFNKLKEGIESGELYITELNNYGDDLTSYFTDKQIAEIADVYYNKYHEKLKIVTKNDTSLSGFDVNTIDENGDTVTVKLSEIAEITNKNAVKKSGYASTQMNVTHKFGGLGELQIRGQDLNSFADVEHIPYDIKQGKISILDDKYSDVYSLIKGMDDVTYNEYNEYLTSCYEQLRLHELGIDIKEPELTFSGADFSDEEIELLSKDGLIKIASGH